MKNSHLSQPKRSDTSIQTPTGVTVIHQPPPSVLLKDFKHAKERQWQMWWNKSVTASVKMQNCPLHIVLYVVYLPLVFIEGTALSFPHTAWTQEAATSCVALQKTHPFNAKRHRTCWRLDNEVFKIFRRQKGSRRFIIISSSIFSRRRQSVMSRESNGKCSALNAW